MRLIDADALIEFSTLCMTQDDEWAIKVSTIESAPTVLTPDPVKHGEWVKDFTGIDWTYGPYICSECHERYGNFPGGYHMGKANYCPNCGAKMDLEG